MLLIGGELPSTHLNQEEPLASDRQRFCTAPDARISPDGAGLLIRRRGAVSVVRNPMYQALWRADAPPTIRASPCGSWACRLPLPRTLTTGATRLVRAMTRSALPPGPTPCAVAGDVQRLHTALDAEIPAKTATNLLIGTWNLRSFSDLTHKWRSAVGDSPKRDWHSVACIAAIIDRFDITAVQETRRNTTALFALLTQLGPGYRVIASDVTEGDPGNGERLAFIYDAERVQPSGLVGEIVLPADATSSVEQFARTPYAAGFVRAETDFILTTVHVLWGKTPTDRIAELTAFATWMRTWAVRPQDWNRNLLVLGDFNLDRINDPLFEAFASTGLWPPAELDHVPRTIFNNDKNRHYYDQIAWFNDPTKPDLPSRLENMRYTRRGGGFDFLPHAFQDLDKTQVSWRISDHYPLWVEFAV